MIIGVGTDMIEIDRVLKALETPRFAERTYTAAERAMLAGRKPASHAGNVAAKEAVAKALGTGFTGFAPVDIEILRDDAGKPIVNLYNEAEALRGRLGVARIHVSISDCGEYATAFAVAEC